MQKQEIIVTGFGGQGIILAGKIIGESAAIGDHKESTFVQSYGPESRGGACNAQVIISDTPIFYPYVRKPDILVCMSQSGYEKFQTLVDAKTLLIIDQDLVKLNDSITEYFAIPATRFAEEMGRKMMANIVMLGFFTAVSNAVSFDAAKQTVMTSVPKGTEESNWAAFSKGHDFGLTLLKSREKHKSLPIH
ncbi:MAG: 2-oxoacid:acceptor oxidoreductase family protein [Desulfobacterales bacterium]|nr:2-oxoacid:acceptor oxidoreductase family protein [Desulfobacterales bacterium]